MADRTLSSLCLSRDHCDNCFAGSDPPIAEQQWYGGTDEAKLVQVIVAPTMRGRGAATSLIRFAGASMLHDGFDRLYARIWVTNLPSIRAFERAGWRRIALVLHVYPPWVRRRGIRLQMPRRVG